LAVSPSYRELLDGEYEDGLDFACYCPIARFGRLEHASRAGDSLCCVIGQIGSGDEPEGATDKDVGRKVFLGGIP
jgi:hypothetical protein